MWGDPPLCYDRWMDTFNTLLLIAHVAGGVFALGVAPLAMATRKGGEWHVRWGRIYFWTMMWMAFSAVVLSCTKRFIFFLVGVTVLSFYDTLTGVRCLYQKGRVANNARGKLFDWCLTGAVVLFGGTMIGYALLSPGLNLMLVVLNIIFGAILLSEASKDVWRFIRPSSDPKWWWYYHMERMLVSWLAGVTALAVNQIGPRLPSSYRIWVWIGPAIVLTPLIMFWVRYYRKKFAPRPAPATAGQPVAIG